MFLETKENDVYIYRGSDEPNMKYLAEVTVSDPMYIIVSEEKTIAFVADLEIDKIQSEGSVDEVISMNKYADGADVRGDLSREIKSLQSYLDSKEVSDIAVGPYFPSLGFKLLNQSFNCTVLDVDPVMQSRQIKTEAEIDQIQDAQKQTEQVMKSVKELFQKTKVVNSEVHLNGDPLTYEYVQEYIREQVPECSFPEGLIVATYPNPAHLHGSSEGTIPAHKLIMVDIYPQFPSGYFGDMTRTFVVGEPDEKAIEMHKAICEAKETVINALQDGVVGDTLHTLAMDTLEEYGFETTDQEGFIHSTGHSIGLELHEPPRIASGSPEMKSGMVLTIEPGLYYRDVGGMRTEDMVVVTDSDCKNLNMMDDSLQVIDPQD